MNTFANGLTCSTFVGKTVHCSVAIYNSSCEYSLFALFCIYIPKEIFYCDFTFRQCSRITIWQTQT